MSAVCAMSHLISNLGLDQEAWKAKGKRRQSAFEVFLATGGDAAKAEAAVVQARIVCWSCLLLLVAILF